jgi:NADH-quinone oxidoreductase subunit E
VLDLTTAEVAAVATFYTQYKRHPNGTYTVGVCTNTLCAVMGGDAIWDSLEDHLGVGHDETTPDGAVTLERIECNAACDYAPVVMVNWEFFDNQTPASSRDLVDRLRAGRPRRPDPRRLERVLVPADVPGCWPASRTAAPTRASVPVPRPCRAPCSPVAATGRPRRCRTAIATPASGGPRREGRHRGPRRRPRDLHGRPRRLSSARDGGVAPPTPRAAAPSPASRRATPRSARRTATRDRRWRHRPPPQHPRGCEQKVDRAREGDGTTRKDG